MFAPFKQAITRKLLCLCCVGLVLCSQSEVCLGMTHATPLCNFYHIQLVLSGALVC